MKLNEAIKNAYEKACDLKHKSAEGCFGYVKIHL